MPLDLDDALDRIYAAELADFVDERKQVARELKQEGRKAEAATVEELRKPSLPAWTVNQLARRKKKDMAALLRAGERLGEAQQALLAGGGRSAFTEARRREQDALDRLREDAAWMLGRRATDATLDRVVATLGAAAVTADGREQLAAGRLVADVAPQGFEAFAAIAPAGSGPHRTPAKTAPAKKAPPPASPKGEPVVDRRKAKQEAIDRARETLAGARELERDIAEQLPRPSVRRRRRARLSRPPSTRPSACAAATNRQPKRSRRRVARSKRRRSAKRPRRSRAAPSRAAPGSARRAPHGGGQELARPLRPLTDDSGVVQDLEVVARGRLRDLELDLTALQLTAAGAPGELPDDLEADRDRERLQHGQPIDVVEARAEVPRANSCVGRMPRDRSIV